MERHAFHRSYWSMAATERLDQPFDPKQRPGWRHRGRHRLCQCGVAQIVQFALDLRLPDTGGEAFGRTLDQRRLAGTAFGLCPITAVGECALVGHSLRWWHLAANSDQPVDAAT